MTDTESAVTDGAAEEDSPLSGEPSEPSGGETAHRIPTRRFWVHALALLAVLLCLVPVLDSGNIAVPDEGVYLAQAANLQEGSWSRPRTVIDVDPRGLWAPVTQAGVVGDRVIAYYSHPLYPLIITPAFILGGIGGVLVLSAAFTWLTALFTALITCQINSRLTLPALWVTAILSPLFFDAYLVQAHSLAAATTAIALFGIVTIYKDGRLTHLAYILPLLSVSIAVRGESAIVVGCIAIVLIMSAFKEWHSGRDARKLGIVGIAAAIVAITTVKIDRIAAQHIGHVTFDPAVQSLSSRWVDIYDGAWSSILRPFNGSWVNASIWLPLAVTSIAISTILLRLATKRAVMALCLLVFSALSIIPILFIDAGVVSGLLPAFPLLVFGIPWLGREQWRNGITRMFILIAMLAAGLTIYLNYGVGGGTEWGGRYFHSLLPMVVPLCLVGSDRALSHFSSNGRLIASASLLMISLSLSFTAARTQRTYRTLSYDLVSSVTMAAESVSTGSDAPPLVVWASVRQDGTARAFWNSDFDLIATRSLADVSPILKSAQMSERDSILIVSEMSPVQFKGIFKQQLRRYGWRVSSDATARGLSDGMVLLKRDDDG